MNPGDWIWSKEHRQVCRVVDAQTLWGETTYKVWLPIQDAVVRVHAAQLQPLDSTHPALRTSHLTYVAAAARVADALTQNVLLAPIEASVIPLPHQIRALSRVVSHDRVRYLLADEVGLGKTIEAGLVMRELKLRGLVRRILVIAPKGLVTQWVSEMRLHFNEEFQLVLPEDLQALRYLSSAKCAVRSAETDQFPLASSAPRTSHLGLEEPRIRGLATRLLRMVPGQPIPCLHLPWLPVDVQGFWSLWQISVQSPRSRVQSPSDRHWTRDPRPETYCMRVMPLFLHTDSRILVPTARRIWDQLLTDSPEVQAYLTDPDAVEIFDRQRDAAGAQGKVIYDALVRMHRERLARERENGEYAFAARRRTVERIGLPAVKAHRLAQLAQEERTWRTQLDKRAEISPEMVPLAVARVQGT